MWAILVLATVRLTVNANYDALHHFANFDKLIRQIIGVENKFNDGNTFGLQTIKDNISLLDEETIQQVNEIVIERRLLKKELIPSSEKIYSIFEPHTEWISKGKQNKKVELGHKILISTCQHHFILHHQVIEAKADVELTIPLADKLLTKYPNIESWSMDKGFYSKENKELLSLVIPQLVMPKKGKLNVAEKEEESQKQFKKLRNLHSAVESNINQLEHNGLDRCPDKGLKNYKKYVSLGILSYNLHRLGKILFAIAAKQETKQAA